MQLGCPNIARFRGKLVSGIQSPSGRWTISNDEAAITLEAMSKMLARGDWSLTMPENTRLAVTVGVLCGVLAGARGVPEAEAEDMIDFELIDYARGLLGAFESQMLEWQLLPPTDTESDDLGSSNG